MTIYELRYFKKMVRIWKAKSLLFCLRYDPLIVHSKAKSYNFQFHKNDVTWRCQMAYSPTKQVPRQFCTGKPPRQNSLYKNVSAWTRKYARQWLNVQRAARFSLRWLNVGWIYITCKLADKIHSCCYWSVPKAHLLLFHLVSHQQKTQLPQNKTKCC